MGRLLGQPPGAVFTGERYGTEHGALPAPCFAAHAEGSGQRCPDGVECRAALTCAGEVVSLETIA